HLEATVVAGRALYDKPAASGPTDLQQASSRTVLATAAWRDVHSRAVITERVSIVANRFDETGSIGQVLGRGHTNLWTWRSDIGAQLSPTWTVSTVTRASYEQSAQALSTFTVRQGLLTSAATLDGAGHRREIGAGVELTRRTSASTLAAGLTVSATAP